MTEYRCTCTALRRRGRTILHMRVETQAVTEMQWTTNGIDLRGQIVWRLVDVLAADGIDVDTPVFDLRGAA